MLTSLNDLVDLVPNIAGDAKLIIADGTFAQVATKHSATPEIAERPAINASRMEPCFVEHVSTSAENAGLGFAKVASASVFSLLSSTHSPSSTWTNTNGINRFTKNICRKMLTTKVLLGKIKIKLSNLTLP